MLNVLRTFEQGFPPANMDAVNKAAEEAIGRLKPVSLVSKNDTVVLFYASPKQTSHPTDGVGALIKRFWWDPNPKAGKVPDLKTLFEIPGRTLVGAPADIKLADVIEVVLKDAQREIQAMKIRSVALAAAGLGIVGGLAALVAKRMKKR